nr:uncharacterized protein LOC113841604 [Anas platyrhynchos]XP_038037134.1 uncharacterized protein LOC113842161 [Anas platyrhynchos]
MPGLCQGERWEQVTMRSAALPQLLSWVLEWSSRGSPAAVLFQLRRGILLLRLGGTPQVICPGRPSMVLSSCPRAIPQEGEPRAMQQSPVGAARWEEASRPVWWELLCSVFACRCGCRRRLSSFRAGSSKSKASSEKRPKLPEDLGNPAGNPAGTGGSTGGGRRGCAEGGASQGKHAARLGGSARGSASDRPASALGARRSPPHRGVPVFSRESRCGWREERECLGRCRRAQALPRERGGNRGLPALQHASVLRGHPAAQEKTAVSGRLSPQLPVGRLPLALQHRR